MIGAVFCSENPKTMYKQEVPEVVYKNLKSLKFHFYIQKSEV